MTEFPNTVSIDTESEPGSYAQHLRDTACMRCREVICEHVDADWSSYPASSSNAGPLGAAPSVAHHGAAPDLSGADAP
jgi:hypothetical protein